MRAVLAAVLALLLSVPLARAEGLIVDDTLSVMAPTAEQAAVLLEIAAPVQVQRIDAGVPGWTVTKAGRVVGEIDSTWEIAGSVVYSGRPLDVLVAVSPEARIAGALLVRHNEPVLTLGISDADISAYVAGFKGFDLAASTPDTSALPPVISRATVSTFQRAAEQASSEGAPRNDTDTISLTGRNHFQFDGSLQQIVQALLGHEAEKMA